MARAHRPSRVSRLRARLLDGRHLGSPRRDHRWRGHWEPRRCRRSADRCRGHRLLRKDLRLGQLGHAAARVASALEPGLLGLIRPGPVQPPAPGLPRCPLPGRPDRQRNARRGGLRDGPARLRLQPRRQCAARVAGPRHRPKQGRSGRPGDQPRDLLRPGHRGPGNRTARHAGHWLPIRLGSTQCGGGLRRGVLRATQCLARRPHARHLECGRVPESHRQCQGLRPESRRDQRRPGDRSGPLGRSHPAWMARQGGRPRARPSSHHR